MKWRVKLQIFFFFFYHHFKHSILSSLAQKGLESFEFCAKAAFLEGKTGSLLG